MRLSTPVRGWTLFLALMTVSLHAQDAAVWTGQSKIDVVSYEIDVEITPDRSALQGSTRVTFDVIEDTVSVLFEINNRISLLEILDENDVVYQQSFDNFDSSRMAVRGPDPFRSGDTHTLTFRFDGVLEREEYAYLEDAPITQLAVIGPNGAFLLTEGKWFPQHHLPVDEATLNLKVRVPLGFTVVSAGELQQIDTFGVYEQFTWLSDQDIGQFPVVVGRLFRERHEAEPIPVTFYASEDFEGDFAPFAGEIAQMAEFFSQEFGDLGIQQFNLIDIGNVRFPVTGAEGMILLEEGILKSKAFPLMKMTRRVADQWFVYPVEILSGSDAWLRHGFSSYAALRYLEEKKPDLFETELARLSVNALKYEQRAPTIEGYGLKAGSAEFESVVAAKGAWILYMLRQQVGSDPFHALFTQWYREHVLRGEVTTQQFVEYVNRETGTDYGWFFLQWLESTGVPEFRVEYQVFKLAQGGFRVRGKIEQDIELFRMPMDILIETKGQTEEKFLNFKGRNTPFNFEVETMPLRFVIDPKGKILRDSDVMRVRVHIAIGDEYREREEFIPAIREYEKGKAIEPRSSLAHFRLGQTYFQQHSFTNAANSFRDALNGDLKPDWVEAYTQLHLGKIYDILGERQRAQAEYTKVLNSGVTYMGINEEADKLHKEPYSRPKSLLN